ncbi:MAG: transposase [Desulfosarcina sp.]
MGTRNVGPPAMMGEPSTTWQPQGIAPTVGIRNVGHPPTVGDAMGAFKSLTTNEYIRNVKNNGWPPFPGKLWQRNYYEHIVRNEKSYHQIAEYIQTNPLKWQDDRYYA